VEVEGSRERLVPGVQPPRSPELAVQVLLATLEEGLAGGAEEQGPQVFPKRSVWRV
jgi:hypothetical protein